MSSNTTQLLRTANLSDSAITVALWTPQGRGAVATVKVCGNLDALLRRPDCPIPFRAANGKSLAAQPLGRVVFGSWGAEPSEEVVVCRVSDEELEVSCHGGVAAAQRIMADWMSLSIPSVNWRQQAAASTSGLAADCLETLTHATTLRTASILLDQESAWRDFALRSVDRAEAGDWIGLRNEVAAVLSWQELGRHLIKPFEVVLTGPPNVGKSALLNALVGYQRSVVFDQPGTTRDVVTAETAIDGWPVRLIDTAGLRDDATGLEAAGIELAHEQLVQADLLLQVSDASVEPVEMSKVSEQPDRTIWVVNKIDLIDDPTVIVTEFPQAVAVSARTGIGIEVLIAHIARRLVPMVPAPGTLIPFCNRHLNWLHKLTVAIEGQNVGEVETISALINARTGIRLN